MTPRHQVLSLLAAAYTGFCLGVLTFLLLGLLSERVPKTWEQAMFGNRALPVIALSLVVFVAGSVLAYRWAVAQDTAANEGQWFFGALGSSVVAGGAGMLAFALAHEVLPRRWFSRGGDWDFDPLLEVLAFGLMCALAGFWWVYGRALAPPGTCSSRVPRSPS